MPALNAVCAVVLKVAALTPVRAIAALTVRMDAVAEAFTAAMTAQVGPLRPGGQTLGGGGEGNGGDGEGGGGGLGGDGDGGGDTDLTARERV